MSQAAASGVAQRYARTLLASLGIAAREGLAGERAFTSAPGRLAELTGRADGPGVPCPVPIEACADGALMALARLAPAGSFDDLCGSALLVERADLLGLRRNGRTSPGGACRLLAVGDGAIALNLARDDDWNLVAAWLENEGCAPGEWDRIAAGVAGRPAGVLVERARLLGLAAAADAPAAGDPPPWFTVVAGHALHGGPVPAAAPLVLDLSSLWAGPLCSRLLQRTGARVIKVESHRRPDGARHGSPAFFERLNAGKTMVTLDPATREGRERLLALIGQARVVIEGSRPRAMRQLGLDAERLVHARDDLTWIGLSGYGRGEPQEQWIAYGDDAGVAGGLSHAVFEATGERMFVGDAIGDPLTGLHAALAACASVRAGGSRLISIAMRDVVAHVAGFERRRMA